jgi:hypothetical protein
MSKNPFSTNNRFKMLSEPDAATIADKRKDKYVAPRGNNGFKTNNPLRKTEAVPIARNVEPEFKIEEHLFPSLGGNTQPLSKTATTIKDFKDVVNTVKECPAEDSNVIKPGWVEVSRIGRKNNYRYGAKTEYQKQMEDVAEIENDPNYVMNKAIDSITKQRDQYIMSYNTIHGEGAYEERFIMQPCYGSEYDTDEDSVEDDANDDYEL